MKLFAGNSNPTLAKNIAHALNMKLNPCEITTFSDGEIRVEIYDHVRGKHAFIIQSTCAPTNNNLMELLILADALRRSSVSKITAVIPYYGYARQDRRPDFTRTPITSRLIADMIQTAGITEIVTIDIHSGQQQGFFTIPVINISASPVIVSDIWRIFKTMDNLTIVSPDAGGVPRARSIAKQLGDVNLAIIDKRRPNANESVVMNVIGNVEGKQCIIVDDMIDTAGTLCKAATALKENGATEIYAYATHPVLSGKALEHINTSDINHVVVTDTIPTQQTPKIRTITVANLISETIRRISENQSISGMYVGH